MGGFGQQQFNTGLFGGGSGSTLLQVTDIIDQALRIAGVMKVPGRGRSPEQLNEGMLVLNTMLDEWSIDRLSSGYAYPRQVFDLVPGQQDYLVGPAPAPGNPQPNWQVTQGVRPPRIDYAGMISNANLAQPLEIPMHQLTYEGWKDIPIKNVESTLCLQFYYEPEFPNGIVHVWPVPTITNQIALYTWQIIGAFSVSSAVPVLPPGYLKAIMYCLAEELNGRFPSAVMKQRSFEIAKESRAMVRRINLPMFEAQCDEAVVSRSRPYNWLTDGYPK